MKQQVKAIMPMKGHSSRIPGKNIRNLCGKPMYHWIVDEMLKVDEITDIIINTDSDLIFKDLIESYSGEKVHPVKRPESLLGDFVSMNSLIKHDMDVMGGEHFLQTHATNPLLKSSTIRNAIYCYFKSLETNDSLFSVNRIQSRVYDKSGKPLNYDQENPAHIHTQNIEPLFQENSNIYLFSRSSFYSNMERRLGLKPQMFEMEFMEAVDVDEEEDFQIAEILMKRRIEDEL